MFTEGQILYIQDVLGVSPDEYRQARAQAEMQTQAQAQAQAQSQAEARAQTRTPAGAESESGPIRGAVGNSHNRAAPRGDEDEFAIADVAAVTVLTKVLSPEQKLLLTKILASVQLAGYDLREVESVSEIIGSDEFGSPHVFVFDEGQTLERTAGESVVWWSFPAVSEMMGSGPEVTAHKKATWNLLQQFAKEKH